MADDDIAYGSADLGLILGSTNEDIWNEEMGKEPGLRALRVLCQCQDPSCDLTAREHVQDLFDDPAHLRAYADLLAPHDGKDHDALMKVVDEEADRQRAEMMQALGGDPEVGGVFLRLGPDGIEAVPIDEVPAEIKQAMVERVLNDPDAPEEIKAHVRSLVGGSGSVH